MKAQKTVCITLEILGCEECRVVTDCCYICWVEFEVGDEIYCYRPRRQHLCESCYERLKERGEIE